MPQPRLLSLWDVDYFGFTVKCHKMKCLRCHKINVAPPAKVKFTRLWEKKLGSILY